MVSGQSGNSDIGAHFWSNMLKPAWMLMRTKMQEYIHEGRLRRTDPWMATLYFKGLLDADLVERKLHGDIRGPEAELVADRVKKAVDIFLRCYGPEAPDAERPVAA